MSAINIVELVFSLLQTIFLSTFVIREWSGTNIVVKIFNICMIALSVAITGLSIKEIANDEDENRSISEEKKIKSEQQTYNRTQFGLSLVITAYLIGFYLSTENPFKWILDHLNNTIPGYVLNGGLAVSSIATIVLTAMTMNSSS